LLRRHPDIAGDRLGFVVGERTLARRFAHDFTLSISTALGLAVRRMAVKRARRRELAELVADHLLRNLHRNVLLAVIDAEGQADELRQNGRAAAPDLDDLVPSRPAGLLRLLQQIAVDEWTFPDR